MATQNQVQTQKKSCVLCKHTFTENAMTVRRKKSHSPVFSFAWDCVHKTFWKSWNREVSNKVNGTDHASQMNLSLVSSSLIVGAVPLGWQRCTCGDPSVWSISRFNQNHAPRCTVYRWWRRVRNYGEFARGEAQSIPCITNVLVSACYFGTVQIKP